MKEHIKPAFAAAWYSVAGLTIAQINALLGCLSLLVGISYQIWKWRKEARQSR